MPLDRNLRFQAEPDATATLSRNSLNATVGAAFGYPIWSISYLNFAGWGGNNCAVNRGKITLSKAIKQTVDGPFTLTAVAVSGGNAVYTTNASLIGKNYAGWGVEFTGFVTFGNNGWFIITSNTTSGTNDTITVTAISHATETHAGTATFPANTTSYVVNGTYGAGISGMQVGAKFVVSDFPTNAGNNTTQTGATKAFVCIASDITAIAVTNSGGVNETNAASAWPAMSNPSTGATDACTTFLLTQAIRQTAFSRTITSVTFSTPTITINMATDGSSAHAYQNWVIQVTGLANAANNGFFMCTDSTATTLQLNNINGVAEASPPGGSLAVSSVNSTSYLGTTGGASVATAASGTLVDSLVTVTNFGTNAGNNSGGSNPSAFKVLASSATAFGVTNSNGVNETANSFATNRRGIGTINSGMSWAFTQSGYTNTNDGGQIVWNTQSFIGTITGADGTIGGGVVRYTTSGSFTTLRIGQVFTVQGTTSATFDGSAVITAIHSSTQIDVTPNTTPSNTTQTGLTANGWVLAGTLGPGVTPSSSNLLYDVGNVAANAGTNHHMPTTFRGVWSPTATYQAFPGGGILTGAAAGTGIGGNGNALSSLLRNGTVYPTYVASDVVWNSAQDPNTYLCQAKATHVILSATGNNTTITFTVGTFGNPGQAPSPASHNIVVSEFVTVTGCNTGTLNVVNAKVTAIGNTTVAGQSVTNSTFTVAVTGFNTTESEVGRTALVNVVPSVTGDGTSDPATQANHWLPWNYEIFQSNDGLTPYYTKVEYGQGPSTTPCLTVQFGSGTDGNGGLTGRLSYREPLGVLSGVSGSSALGEWLFFGIGSGANLLLFGPRTGAASNSLLTLFVVQRSKNNSGVDTSDYITYVLMGAGRGSTTTQNWRQNSLILATLPYNNISSGQANFYVPQLSANVTAVNQGIFTIGISTSQGAWRLGVAGSANVAVAPVFPNVGCFDNPLTLIQGMAYVAANSTDFVDNTTFTCTMYGSTKTYLMTDATGGTNIMHTWPSGTGATNVGAVALRWEA